MQFSSKMFSISPKTAQSKFDVVKRICGLDTNLELLTNSKEDAKSKSQKSILRVE